MGANGSVPKVRANDLARFNDSQTEKHKKLMCGWLCKAGLNNTQLQRRWCAIHDLKLFYFEGPRSEEPNGVVNLKGAIVTESKRIPMAFEIQTGALFSERGMEKRVFYFTPVGAEENRKARVADPAEKEKEHKRHKKLIKKWIKHIEEESARAFLPS